MARTAKTAAAAPVAADATVAAPVFGPAPRKNHHGIGKGWTGNTTVTRMAHEEIVAYHAYLSALTAPNARQLRHLARTARALALASVATE